MNRVEIIPAAEVQARAGGRERRLRVAAYCRVSTDEERQLGSFENQIEYFTRLIDENAGYELVKIYSDEGISGCSTRSRKGFCAMIADCEAGLIDFVITKSISRFARNTQDSLNYTRRLREMGIGIYFEKEGINTLESSGELLLTLFSCFAQEESRSISENTAWGIRSKFKQGVPHLNAGLILGYDKGPEGGLVINEAEAETVRRIYRLFLEGWSLGGIARALNSEGVPGVHGEPRWCAVTVTRLIGNEKYKGALLMQKTFTANYLTKQHIPNTGQLNQYYVEHDHPPIIDPEEWEAAQEELARRRSFREAHRLRELGGGAESGFHGRLFCAVCGGTLGRSCPAGARRAKWQCKCGRRVDETALRGAFAAAFNSIVEGREELMPKWHEMANTGTPLERLRARQMLAVTAPGPIPAEIPELTRAVLREALLREDGGLIFTLLSGDTVRSEL